MGEVPAGLDRHDEVVGGPLPPALECLPRRQPVEAVVVLHGLVALGVLLEPAALGHFLRVEATSPVAILPAGRSDQHRHGRYLPYWGRSTRAIPAAMVVSKVQQAAMSR